MSDDKPWRVLPRVTPENEHFWRGGAEGELRFQRCDDCSTWIHPPSPICPTCLSRSISIQTTSGRATVHAYTVNWQSWIPTLELPYVVAIVELPEQEGLRLTTNIINCEPDDVHTGMPVQVFFDHYDDRGYEVWLPMFEPVEGD